MPTAAPPKVHQGPYVLSSRPQSAAPVSSVSRRTWNPPPEELFPPEPVRSKPRRPTSAAHTRTSISARTNAAAPAANTHINFMPRKTSTPSVVATVSPRATTGRRLATPPQGPDTQPASSPPRRASVIAEAQIDAISRGSPKRLSVATWTRIHKAQEQEESELDRRDRRNRLTHDQQLEAAAATRRDAVRTAQVTRTLKKQDVSGEDVRPLIEIAYWSPFLEVRRDAAAAIASLTRNPANLEVLSEVGTLGALISMLNAGNAKVDPAIARDCAHALASMAKLDSVKLKILEAPEGLECIFGMLHSPDLRLRCIAFEVVHNLLTIEELRLAVAKREGFAFMLESCTSKDARIRLLAASILHRLAASPDNRFLFYHSTHFDTLATLLQDPFIERDLHFRRELLSFIHLLVADEENGRKFVDLHLVPTLLLVLDSPKATHAICVLVVSIVEALATNRKNHPALVVANALPRLVQLCFHSQRGLPDVLTTSSDKHLPSSRRPPSPRHDQQQQPPPDALSATTVTISPEVNALLRPAFTVFCEMAKNPHNREHVIRSKLVDCITARGLYAASDKRVRRSVITLLTFLVCRERERCATLATTATLPPQETDFKHYMELLARGIVKCLFGILAGNDFSMKVDALAALAQLSEDAHSRLTLCKPPLLRALKEFAFHPLVQTRTHIATIIANFAERAENILKLVDEGMLAILVKYVCPLSRTHDVLVEATRAIAAISMVHVTRQKLVESGVLGTLLQFAKAPSTAPQVLAYATTAIRNLRHDAAALCIQAVYRGWCVRVHHARSILTRKRRVRKMTSVRKLQTDQAFVAVMERFASDS